MGLGPRNGGVSSVDRYSSYQVNRELGDGSAQGRCYHVTCKEDDHQYTMKMIECMDEDEAQQILTQSSLFASLNHPHISKIKEVFMHFSKYNETIFVCVVAPFYATGELNKVIEQQRSKEGVIPEAIYKKWLAQAVEALKYLHDRNIVHRDLRPSNVFLTEKLDLKVGDLACEVVMRDLMQRKRSSEDYLSWMAPEVGLKKPYFPVADIWSLACIFLELGTTATGDTVQGRSTRQRMRKYPEMATEALKAIRVTGNFAKELVITLQVMLRYDARARASIGDLLGDGYIRSCLKLGKSDLIEVDTKRAALAISIKPTTTKRIPDDPLEIYDFLAAHVQRVGCVVGGLEALGALALRTDRGVFAFNSTASARVCHVMSVWAENVYVQIAAINFLRAVAANTTQDGLGELQQQCVSPVVVALTTHDLSSTLVETACHVIVAMADSNAECARAFGDQACVPTLVALWRENADSALLVQCISTALGALAVDEDTNKKLCSSDCCNDAIEALTRHPAAPAALASVCTLLWILSVDETLLTHMQSGSMACSLVAILRAHEDDPKLVLQVGNLLSVLLVDARCAESIARTADDVDGIGVIVGLLQGSSGDVAIIETLCTVVQELCEHVALHEQILDLSAIESLARLRVDYQDVPAILQPCTTALSLLTDAR
eukprot:m.386564 g.386564  ORF g.386564 m.386564 type:complete len:663 (-) comp21017_c0_seq1:374-2362(-)